MNSLVGAASTHVRDLLTGRPATGVVRHVGRRRLGIEVAGRLVVLDGDSDQGTLPCTVVVPGLAPARLTAIGDRVEVGASRLRAPGGEVRVARWWDPARVRPATGQAEAARRLATSADRWSVPDAVRARLGEAARSLLDGDPARAAAALTRVLGLGAGSTPDADDAVAGLLLAARCYLPMAAQDGAEAAARSVAAAAPGRTTLLSAELLRGAAAAMACPAVARHLMTPAPETAATVRGLGASSGAATLAGIDVMARVLAGRSARRVEVAA